jgi:N-acetylneuraminate synthase
MKIAGINVGDNFPPFVIAEMSGNHNQSLERALQIVDAAADAGAHALKIQTYTADTMTLDISVGEFFISNANSLWDGTSLYDLYKRAYTPWEWHEPIFKHARKRGLVAFSTPFDATAVEFLEGLDVPCYKIASFENTDIPLIRLVATTGKPLIISTGMATMDEIAETVDAARSAGCRDLVLLKCTSSYPSSPLSSNIRTIPELRNRFGCDVGLSDHTMGLGVSIASVALGASVIEKHFTIQRSDGGVDSAFSMEPHELTALVEQTKNAWQSLGEIQVGPTEEEIPSLQFRRSLYVVNDVEKDQVFSTNNIRAIRPGSGLPPKMMDEVIGLRATRDIKRGTPLSLDHFE